MKTECHTDHVLKEYIHKDIEICHQWGDDWWGWKELHDAINQMSEAAYACKFTIYDKEKWGSYDCSLLSFWNGNCVLRALGIVCIINYFQKRKYNRIVQKILRMHPKLVNELIANNNLYYLITPGKDGIVDGKFIHGKYWRES